MSVTTAVKSVINSLPGIREVFHKCCGIYRMIAAVNRNGAPYVPPGHFYSPIPSMAEIRRDESKIFGPVPYDIPGVDLRESRQIKLLEEFVHFYSEMPF